MKKIVQLLTIFFVLIPSICFNQSVPSSILNNKNPFLSPNRPNVLTDPTSQLSNNLPQASETIPISNAMLRDYLPKFSNMDYGFLYEFSTKNANRTLFFSDIFLPIQKSKENVLFFQSYFGYNSFSSSGSYENNTASYRMDVSAGGGYRFFLPGPLIQGFGLNLFFDTSKIYGQWYNSWGAGLEVVWQGPGNSLFDLSINNYGNQFADLEDAVNLWRKGDVNFDLEAGYSSGFYDGTVDLRVKANAYQFSLGDDQYISGYKVGADLKTGNGLLKVGYDLGHDKDKGTYNSISAVINVGFSPEDILSGKNPFSMPQPIFMSPQRNPERILSQKVHRNTNLPDKVVTANRKSQPYFQVTINGPYGYGSGTYTQSSNIAGTWNIIPVTDGDNYRTIAASYTVTLSGDISGLTFPVTATITPNATVATGVFTVSQSGTAGAAETITFNNASDLVKIIPPSGNTLGTSAVPNIARGRNSGSSGSQGTITVTGSGVQSLIIDVVSSNEPTPGVVYFTVAMNGPYSYGSGTYSQSSNTAGTWNIIPAIDGANYRTRAASYTVTLSGDTGSLTYPLTATITPNVTVATGAFTVSQSGTAGAAETITFNNASDLVKTIPSDGNSIGTSAVPDITRERNSGSSGTQGTITVTATGVQSLTIDVVSGSEPTPGVVYFTVAMNGPYSYGSGTYTQSSNTSGTWNITPAIDGANYRTKAASYTVTLSGETGSLTYPVTATITPNATVATGVFTVAQSGTAGAAETVTFANSGDLVKTIPPNGNSVGTTSVPDITRQRGSGSSGSQGNITVTATGVQTLTVGVVSGSEPVPGPPFTRTGYVGNLGGGGSGVIVQMNANILAEDLVGVNSVVVTWSGPAVPGWSLIKLWKQYASPPYCFGPEKDLNGSTSPPGLTITDPSFWTLACGPWDAFSVGNYSGVDLDYGTVTLTFLP